MKRSALQRVVSKMAINHTFDFLPDDKYLKLLFWARMNKKLDLEMPKTLNEKIQWLKLHDRKDIYTEIVDKYVVRNYIKNIIGDEFLIPIVGGPWSTFEEIDFDALPNQFVLKCTHDSGGVVICKDKQTFDLERAKKRINKSLKSNYYKKYREWPYKNVEPRIIAERYLIDNSGIELKDYKILCFNGIPDNIMVCTGRNTGKVKYYLFDRDWNFLRYNNGDDKLPADFTLDKPQYVDEMFTIATKLANPFSLARIDLYEAEGKVWFGEITFYPDSGFDLDITDETDRMFGEKLKLIAR